MRRSSSLLSLAIASFVLAACGGKIENTGSLGAGVGPGKPGPPDAGAGQGGDGSGTAAVASALDGDFSHLAADGTDFYLSGNGGRIVRLPKAGGPPVEVLSGDAYFGESLAVDATHLYWSRLVEGQIVRMPKGGGPIEVVADGQVRPWGIALDAARVYWASEGDAVAGVTGRPPGGQIASAAKTGGDVKVLAPDQQTPRALTVDGDWVYYGESGWGDTNGTIKRVPRTGGAIETFATRVDSVASIVVAGGWIGWVGMTSFHQTSIADPGGVVHTVTPVPNTAAIGGGLASDGQSFFFGYSGDGGGEVLACAIGSATTRSVAKPTVPSDATHFIAQAVLAEGEWVYWLDGWWSYSSPKMQSRLGKAPH